VDEQAGDALADLLEMVSARAAQFSADQQVDAERWRR
jgi:hypothetical protein